MVKFTEGVLVTIDWFVLLAVLLRVGLHPRSFVTRETLERLLVVPALTLAVIPFLAKAPRLLNAR